MPKSITGSAFESVMIGRESLSWEFCLASDDFQGWPGWCMNRELVLNCFWRFIEAAFLESLPSCVYRSDPRPSNPRLRAKERS